MPYDLVSSSSKSLVLLTPGENRRQFEIVGTRYAPSFFPPIRISSYGQDLGIRNYKYLGGRHY